MDMHLCAAKCCDDKSSSIESVQRCVQNCSTGVTKAERYVHHQLQDFQNRLQRCVMVSKALSVLSPSYHHNLLTFSLPIAMQ